MLADCSGSLSFATWRVAVQVPFKTLEETVVLKVDVTPEE